MLLEVQTKKVSWPVCCRSCAAQKQLSSLVMSYLGYSLRKKLTCNPIPHWIETHLLLTQDPSKPGRFPCGLKVAPYLPSSVWFCAILPSWSMWPLHLFSLQLLLVSRRSQHQEKCVSQGVPECIFFFVKSFSWSIVAGECWESNVLTSPLLQWSFRELLLCKYSAPSTCVHERDNGGQHLYVATHFYINRIKF